jgi:hypothetical protein
MAVAEARAAGPADATTDTMAATNCIYSVWDGSLQSSPSLSLFCQVFNHNAVLYICFVMPFLFFCALENKIRIEETSFRDLYFFLNTVIWPKVCFLVHIDYTLKSARKILTTMWQI